METVMIHTFIVNLISVNKTTEFKVQNFISHKYGNMELNDLQNNHKGLGIYAKDTYGAKISYNTCTM